MKVRCKYDALVPVESLKPFPKNRNQHSDEQIARLALLLRYQGVRAPIVVATAPFDCIAKGHGTLDAIIFNGGKEAPVVYQDFDDEEQLYAYVQSDNAIAAWAELDLSGINADLGDLGPDFDIDLLGIKDFTLDVSEKHDGDPDAVPETPKVARTQRGELWTLGDHRLLCGDATLPQNVIRIMSGDKAIVCLTDPPYSVAYEKQQREPGRRTRQQGGDAYEDPKDAADLLRGLFDHVPSDVVVMTYPIDRHFRSVADSTKEWDLLYECIWLKNHFAFAIGKRFKQKHESILIFRRKNGVSTFNVPADQSTVFEYSKPAKNPDHPTPKPVELYEKLVEFHSDKGDLVFEPFTGSGTTVIACETQGRRCRGIEFQPQYVDVILQRWSDFTGHDPVREDGKTWSSLRDGN